MTQGVQAYLTQQINIAPGKIALLSQANGPLSILTDKPTRTSYTIQKIETLCTASLQFSWTTQSGRETSSHSYRFSQSEVNFPFFLSLLPEARIREIVREGMLEETSSFAEIEPDQLDPKTKLIYTTFTASDETIRHQACEDLVAELISQSNVPIVLSKETLEPLMRKTLDSALLMHPGLFRSALENEEHNPMARTMIQTVVAAKMAEISNEKDRISRIQQAITGQLVDNQKKFTNFVAECSNLLQGKTDIVQTATLDNLESKISLSNGSQTNTIRLCPRHLKN